MTMISPGPFQLGTNFGFLVVSKSLRDDDFIANYKCVRESLFVILFFRFLSFWRHIFMGDFSQFL